MKKWFLIGCWMIWASSANALPVGLEFWNQIGPAEGLSQISVNSILQDHRGLMWFGTQDGLNCYDGQRMQVYRQIPFDSTSLSDDYITALFEDSQQRLWVGTTNGLNCYQFSTGLFRRIGPTKTVIKALTEDKNHVLWIGTEAGWLTLKPNETTLRPAKESPANPKKLLAAKLTPLLPPQTMITALLTDRTGVVWVGTHGQGIFRFRFEAISQEYELLDTFEEDFFDKNGLKSSHITCLYEGHEPNEDVVWVGTREAGVQLYSRSKNTFRHWERLFTKEPAGGRSFFGLTTDKRGYLWAGTYSHLYRIHRQTRDIKSFTVAPNTVIETTMEDSQGRFWAGGNNGLFRYDYSHERFTSFHLPPYDEHNPWVFRIYEDIRKELWVGTRGYLANIKPSGKTEILRELSGTENTKIKLQNVGTIQRDAQGAMWIGMRHGLVYWPTDGKKARLFLNNPGDAKSLISNTVLDVHIDPKQRVWICTAKGLSQAKNQNGKIEFEHFTEKEGLPNSFVYGALSDHVGNLWLTTNGGLVRFNPEHRTFRTYTEQDGLGGMEFNSGGFHRSYDGELFLGGNGMLLSLRPEQIVTNRHLPKIVLTSFRKFEKPVPEIAGLLAKKQPIELNYDDNFFSFEWAALDYTNPSRNQYAYRLEGFEKDWVYIGSRRFVGFTNLNPGKYTLWVKAANSEGVWNEKDLLRISLVIKPPFWQTWWFYVLVAALAGMIAKLLYDYRVRQLLAVERAKLEENERVRKLAAQDLHDEFGNTLTRISLLTELIKNRLNGQANGEIGGLLTKIGDNSNRMYQGTKDFIWAINPDHDNFYEIAIRLKDFGEDVFDKTGIRFDVRNLTDELRTVTLPMGESRHLVLLFKEAISNTLKHAQATEVTLTFGVENGEMSIQWQDNGKGFSSEQPRPGNGLTNIQTRARKIDGTAVIQSVEGKGTSVVFRKVLSPLLTH
ncbi:MAG: two-component regulator propeller domain-containing protein [Spirosomataceae bacterium]